MFEILGICPIGDLYANAAMASPILVEMLDQRFLKPQESLRRLNGLCLDFLQRLS